MIKAILFDIDGVVINGEKFGQRLEKDLGVSPSQANLFFKNEFTKCLVGKQDLKSSISKYLIDWKWQGSVDEFLVYWFSIESSLDKDLLAFIQEARSAGIRCFVVTNQEKYRAKYLFSDLGLNKFFDGFFASCTVGLLKSDTEFFRKVLKEINEHDFKKVLFWDDTEENLVVAKKLGIKAEKYSTFSQFKSKMNEYLDKSQA